MAAGRFNELQHIQRVIANKRNQRKHIQFARVGCFQFEKFGKQLKSHELVARRRKFFLRAKEAKRKATAAAAAAAVPTAVYRSKHFWFDEQSPLRKVIT